MIDLSVVVVSWNTRELLLDCLTALERELHACERASGLHSETWLVDNGSSDGSAEAVRQRFPGVEVIALPENRGFAAGANAALERASGRCVLLLNSDAMLTPGCVEECLRVLDAEPGAGVVGPQLLHRDGRLQNSVHAFPSLVSEILPRWLLELLRPRRFPSKRHAHSRPFDVDAVLGAALFVRRDVIERVGPLCEDYFFFLEETDWCWRIRRAGWRVLQAPRARAVHLSGASSKRRDPARTRIEFHRSLYRFLRANRGRGSARAVLAVRVVKGLVSLALLVPAAVFCARARTRLRERGCLLLWHLSGCPNGWGLEGWGGSSAVRSPLDGDHAFEELSAASRSSRDGAK